MRKGILGIMLAIIFLFIGCTNAEVSDNETINIDIEKEIQDIGNDTVSSFEFNTDIHVNINKNKDRFEMCLDGKKEKLLTMLINCDFYDNKAFEVPKYEKELDVPNKIVEMYEKSKEVVINYIESSKYIRADDKERCKQAVNNIKLHNGNFSEEYSQGALMTTNGNNIYINNSLIEYCSEKECIHELIHVVSNVTNEGTKYENSSYRASMLNEAITDIIASGIAYSNDFSSKIENVYESFYYEAYFMIGRFDMLSTYYYSDGYEQIPSNLLDMYVLIMNNHEDGVIGYIWYIQNEFAKT